MSLATEDLSALEARTRALLASDALTTPTRAALQGRMDQRFEPTHLLSPDQRRTLEAACLRLIPEPDLVRRTALPAAFEAKLAKGLFRGWRYAEAPDDLTLYRAGLDALDVAARAATGTAFADLATEPQDKLLKVACKGEPPFDGSALDHWFEELLTALTELYYAHPLVQVSIGYDGMADAHGPQAVGFQAVSAEAGRLGR
ncbi:gluconate 2-dehydrogenase subunit 3 family protein [Caulobacter sp. S45]|uniref:gluconate 2-dehydrogenase subunit 3 family protein n=1 Tax=Caulobacter sp. S45 TaxID=1641861 RepID=UPI001575D88E|nr:gluconate 2-dehydrogenase subunit 3 family protein [Caulobacter sp. S45]